MSSPARRRRGRLTRKRRQFQEECSLNPRALRVRNANEDKSKARELARIEKIRKRYR